MGMDDKLYLIVELCLGIQSLLCGRGDDVKVGPDIDCYLRRRCGCLRREMLRCSDELCWWTIGTATNIGRLDCWYSCKRARDPKGSDGERTK